MIDSSQILQKIYDSEIHLSIGWLWDGGIDFSVGADLSYLQGQSVIESTGTNSFDEAVVIIAERCAIEYPESSFSEWWNTSQKEISTSTLSTQV